MIGTPYRTWVSLQRANLEDTTNEIHGTSRPSSESEIGQRTADRRNIR
jgi:hypothetical protein